MGRLLCLCRPAPWCQTQESAGHREGSPGPHQLGCYTRLNPILGWLQQNRGHRVPRFSWDRSKWCLVAKVLHHGEWKAQKSLFAIFSYTGLKNLWTSALYLKSNPVITILLCNCIFCLRKPLPVTLPRIHFYIDLVTKPDFLRLYYSFTIVWRIHNSKPYTITFSIKKLSRLYILRSVASSFCCGYEKFWRSRAGFHLYKVPPRSCTRVGFVWHHLQRDLSTLLKSRILQTDSTLQKLYVDRIPTAELFPSWRSCIKGNKVLNQYSKHMQSCNLPVNLVIPCDIYRTVFANSKFQH